MSKKLRYIMFAMIYFAEGAILGYITALNSLYLLSFNISMTQIGLVSTIAMVPFVLKIFLGMLSDRFNLLGWGHRKPYIIIGLLLQGACLLVVPLLNPGEQYGLFVMLAFLMVSGMALYDTCTDGLALDTTPPEEEGRIQGAMVIGRALGVIAVGGMGFLAQQSAWGTVFIALAVLTFLPLPLVLGIAKEAVRTSERRFEWKAFAAFKHGPVLALALVGALYSLFIYGANEIVNPFLQESFAITLTTAGLLTMTWGVGMVLGGLSGGWVADKIGQRQAMAAGVVFGSISMLLFVFIPSASWAWIIMLVFGLTFGLYDTAFFATGMYLTDPRIAASMFAVLMALANIGIGIGFGAAGWLVDLTGFRATFGILAGFNLLVLLLLPLIYNNIERAPQSSHSSGT